MPSSTLLRLMPLALALAAALAAGEDAACCAARTSVTARGSATTQVVQNITSVSVAVDVGGQRAFDVQIAIGDAMAAVVDFLAAQGDAVRKVETYGSRLSPQYDYDFENYNGNGDPPRTFREYTASGRVSFELLDVSSEVLDGLTGLQSVTVDNVSQRAREDLVDEATLVAVEEAIAASRVKAERMAVAVGKTVGDAISVSDSSTTSYNPYYGPAYGGSVSDSEFGNSPEGLRTVYAEAVVVYNLV